MLPIFFTQNLLIGMIDQQKLAQIAQQALSDASIYLVEASIGKGPKPKVSIIVDAEDGVTIDQCAAISRQVAAVLEEDTEVDEAFLLEVSSPGVDYKLRAPGMFRKHIGREVLVTLQDQSSQQGQLQALAETHLVLEQFKEVHKGQFKSTGNIEIPFEDIDYLQVQVTF